MEYLVNAAQMKEFDRRTIEDYGVPSLVLMERAALAVVQELENGEFNLHRTIIVCGSGNNGADGFAVARLLALKNIDVAVLFTGKEESLTEEAKIQKKICENYGINIHKNSDLSEYTCIVDAIFGVGLSRPLTEGYAEIVQSMNHAGAKILAVDIPSGISADTGAVMGAAVRADKTVTFGFRKIGQVLYPGTEYCGMTVVSDIGISQHSVGTNVPLIYTMTDAKLPPRTRYSNKGTYGKAFLIAGQRDMAGAACLAATACLRMGTGLMRVATEECNRTIIQNVLPEAMLTTYGADILERDWRELLQWSDAVAIGPGLGTSAQKKMLLEQIVTHTDAPLVLDADALNLVSEHPALLRRAGKNWVITPHVGEMARLTGQTIAQIAADIPGTCRRFAAKHGLICILKDAVTAVSDGREVYLNTTGCSGMATGGSGDVLSGMLTGLLAQGMEAFQAAKTAVYLHGKAGEAAQRKLGARSMLAGDIAAALAEVLQYADRERENPGGGRA